MDNTTIAPVAVPSAIVSAMYEGWQIASDLLGGTKAMRVAAERHLPKWPKEEVNNYKSRLQQSTLFPAYSRTITTLSAKPFSRAITFNPDMPEEIKKWCDDIDMTGRNLAEYAADQLYTGLGYGMSFILVDFPSRDGIANTQAAEAAAGLRPYFAKISPTDVLGWQHKLINGVATLTQFRFFECVDEQSDDGYSTKTIRQIKVFNIGTWEIWRQDTQNEWFKYQFGKTTIDFVPIVTVYGEYLSFMCSKPPLIELAYLNIKHWQSQSDQDNILHFARVPILCISTDDETFTLTISGNVGIRVPADAEVKYTEHSGAAIDAGKVALDDLKDEMRQAGAELLVFRDAPATATEIDNDASVGTCALQRITQGLQDSLNIAFGMMAKWVNQTDGGTVKLFNEFGTTSTDDAMNQLIVGLPEARLLSRESTYNDLQRRLNINAGVTWAIEKAKIDADPPPAPPPIVNNALPTNKPAPVKK